MLEVTPDDRKRYQGADRFIVWDSHAVIRTRDGMKIPRISRTLYTTIRLWLALDISASIAREFIVRRGSRYQVGVGGQAVQRLHTQR